MNCRLVTLIFFGQFLSLYGGGQPTAHSIDNILSESFRQLKDSEYDMRFDSLAPAFKRTLIKYLSSSESLNSRLDSLETLITIRQSPDKNIKFYSWDVLTGGSWHDINSFVQFKGMGNRIHYQQLDSDKEMEDGSYTDSEIYAVNEIKEASVTYYLAFGWGTHGSGNQHQVVNLFRIEGDELIQCKSFNNGESILVFEYSRSEKLNLEFDKTTNVLSYDEFVMNEDEQFSRKSGVRKVLKFSKGVFK